MTVECGRIRGSAAPALHRGADRQRPEHHVGRGDIRVRSVDAVRDHATRHAGNDRRKVRVVGAGDDGAEKRDLVGEIDERLLEVVESAVALEVLVIDVRNHRNCRKQLEKTPVALVRLRDHQLAAAQPRVAAEGAEPPADHRRGIQPGAFQHQRDHRRGRRFPVRARDRDAVAQPHELGEHLGARNDGDLPPIRFDDLGVSAPEPPTRPRRRRRLPTCSGACPYATSMPRVAQAVGHFRPLRVGTGHDEPEVREQLGDPAHADAANADEMDAPRLA